MASWLECGVQQGAKEGWTGIHTSVQSDPALGQASTDLALVLLLPRALMAIQGWLVSTDGEEHGLMEGTGALCHCLTSLRKAFSFL